MLKKNHKIPSFHPAPPPDPDGPSTPTASSPSASLIRRVPVPVVRGAPALCPAGCKNQLAQAHELGTCTSMGHTLQWAVCPGAGTPTAQSGCVVVHGTFSFQFQRAVRERPVCRNRHTNQSRCVPAQAHELRPPTHPKVGVPEKDTVCPPAHRGAAGTPVIDAGGRGSPGLLGVLF